MWQDKYSRAYLLRENINNGLRALVNCGDEITLPSLYIDTNLDELRKRNFSYSNEPFENNSTMICERFSVVNYEIEIVEGYLNQLYMFRVRKGGKYFDLVFTNNTKILIEISTLRNPEKSTVVVDISKAVNYDFSVNLNVLKELIFLKSEYKKWVYNVKAQEKISEILLANRVIHSSSIEVVDSFYTGKRYLFLHTEDKLFYIKDHSKKNMEDLKVTFNKDEIEKYLQSNNIMYLKYDALKQYGENNLVAYDLKRNSGIRFIPKNYSYINHGRELVIEYKEKLKGMKRITFKENSIK